MYGGLKYGVYTCMVASNIVHTHVWCVIHMYGSVSYCAYICIVTCCTVRSLRNGCRRKVHKANWLCLHMCARMRGFVCEEYSIIAYVYVFDVCITSCNYVCARVCACVYVCACTHILNVYMACVHISVNVCLWLCLCLYLCSSVRLSAQANVWPHLVLPPPKKKCSNHATGATRGLQVEFHGQYQPYRVPEQLANAFSFSPPWICLHISAATNAVLCACVCTSLAWGREAHRVAG